MKTKLVVASILSGLLMGLTVIYRLRQRYADKPVSITNKPCENGAELDLQRDHEQAPAPV